jgi:uncharacterized repeat protein (TIGR01451 family)
MNKRKLWKLIAALGLAVTSLLLLFLLLGQSTVGAAPGKHVTITDVRSSIASFTASGTATSEGIGPISDAEVAVWDRVKSTVVTSGITDNSGYYSVAMEAVNYDLNFYPPCGRGCAFHSLKGITGTRDQTRNITSSSLLLEFNEESSQYCCCNFQIDIAPVLPTPDDTIQITPSGDWCNACIPSYQSHQVMGNVIRVDAILDYPPDIACVDVITPWGFTVDVGNLHSGSYRVDVYITNIFHTTTLCGTKSFAVGTPALVLMKQAKPDPVQAGEHLTYTIRVTNTGNVTLTATITDILPNHVTPTGLLTWTPVTITAPTGTWMQQVVVTVETGYAGPLTNVVEITTAEGATGVYTETSNVVECCIYLPVILKDSD